MQPPRSSTPTNAQRPRWSVPWFAAELESLLAVIAAALDENGTLIEANAGFLRLIKAEGVQPIGGPAAKFFSQPDFATLVHAHSGADAEIHRGLLTMSNDLGQYRTLRARVWRVNSQVRILAEYDIEELERLNDTVLELNREYADAQLQLAQANVKLRQREAEIVALTLTDPLTDVGNRRRLDQALTTEISRAQRTQQSLCACMADLDHFKRVNDTYGHEVGDKVLAAFGRLLRRETRATDIVTRFGGEEFVVLMPHTDLEHGLATAERIRGAFASFRIEPMSIPVTASFGVAELGPGEQGEPLIRRADKALFAAKEAGRNRVVAG